MQEYKKVTVFWEKELKNSVAFILKVNGQEMGIIKRGESIAFGVYDGAVNILLCPKAPKWFGWKALSITAVTTTEENILIKLGVEYPTGFGKLGDAANYKNQLHTNEMWGLADYREEHLKKW